MNSQNIKIFLIAFLVSFFGFWGLNLFQNNVEEIFYWKEINKHSGIFLAQLNIQLRQKPKEPSDLIISPRLAKELDIKAESAIAVIITPDGKQQIIFKKNIKEKRAIASLTKLMTAVIAEEIYKPEDIFLVSERAVSQEEETGKLRPGESLSLDQLLHIMLIESSNDAAWAIAEGIKEPAATSTNKEHFVELMNQKAKEIGLKDTFFNNPTGLNGTENYSTSYDLFRLAYYILNSHPEIYEITKQHSWRVLYPDGRLHHFISENTNRLLGEIPQIVGGKTGYTEEAGGCMVLVLKESNNNYLIGVVLGTSSPDSRFEEMKKLINYCQDM